jgi:tetratricopeptide (TPR) repeat protein
MLSDLEPAVMHRINAVLGWLDLGCPEEARAEFKSLPSELQGSDQFLELRWIIEVRLQLWDEALVTAERLVAIRQDDASSWLHHAYALRRASSGSLESAKKALRPAFEKFPAEATIPYNLACYACQLGSLDEAREWLAHAKQRGGSKQITAMALKDPDLNPLWPELAKK